MCLITYNRIYVYIDTSLCPVIIDLVIMSSVRSSRITMHHNNPPQHRGSRCHLYAPVAALCAVGDRPPVGAAALGKHLAGGRVSCPQTVPPWAPRLCGLTAGATTAAWLRASAASARALAAADRPCRGLGRGRPPLQRAWPGPTTPFPHRLYRENVARMRRIVLHDSISSHAV
ncbi:hypothetical protein GW17_00010194 [Ensete ventricosum]|nr:hypothetical protein GW17_00010194 [Ensete ventricosum]